MNFFSFEFLGAFTAFFVLYWLCQKKTSLQNVLLITASYLFVYSFSANFAYILFGYTLIIYVLANHLSKHLSNKWVFSLLALTILTFFTLFKYYSFFQESIQRGLNGLGIEVSLPTLEILAPLGLSFYAFHSVSYVVSVGRKEIEKASFLNVVLYLSFFPSIVAGPINRAIAFMPQIQAASREVIDYKKALLLITLAIVKLFLFSAYLSENFSNPVFSAPASYSAGEVLIAIYAYAWYIYFNFSGYTNLVTGIAMLLGFKVPVNFNAPYISVNLKDFWGRWHISLSLFIRDYIYIPLGGNRKGFARMNLNVFIAMVISGLWHGAGMTFVLWGAIHGLGIVLLNLKHKILPPKKETDSSNPLLASTKMWTARIITFHFICLSWVFFGSATFDDAIMMLTQLTQQGALTALRENAYFIVLFWLLFILYPHFINLQKWIAGRYQQVSWIYYPIPLALFLTIVFMLSPSGMPGFIYANF